MDPLWIAKNRRNTSASNKTVIGIIAGTAGPRIESGFREGTRQDHSNLRHANTTTHSPNNGLFVTFLRIETAPLAVNLGPCRSQMNDGTTGFAHV